MPPRSEGSHTPALSACSSARLDEGMEETNCRMHSMGGDKLPSGIMEKPRPARSRKQHKWADDQAMAAPQKRRWTAAFLTVTAAAIPTPATPQPSTEAPSQADTRNEDESDPELLLMRPLRLHGDGR